MLKKLAAGILATAMIFGTTGIISEDFFGQQIAITASAEEGVWGYYHYSSDGEKVWITYYTGDGGDVVIPSEIHGIPVEIIDAFAFMDNESLTSVTIPSSVRIISMSAFDNCVNLEEVYLSEGVETLNISAFGGCPNLRKVVLPRSVSSIGEYVFFNSDDLVIYCYEASYAHQYAIENEIDYILLDNETSEPDDDTSDDETSDEDTVLSDSETDITVSAAAGVLPEGVKLSVEPKTADETHVTYDITLTDAEGNIIQPNGKVSVSIPVPEGWATDKLYVYRAEADGSYTDMKAVYVNGYVTFETDHFSTYILTTEALASIADDNTPDDNTKKDDGKVNADKSNDFPKTGATAGLAFAGIALAGMAVIVSKKNK